MTYWNSKGKREEKLATLHELIDKTLVYKCDPSGRYSAWNAVSRMPKANKGGAHYHLERLRRAKNAYYRLYNDGDSSRIFPVSQSLQPQVNWHNDWSEGIVEKIMDERIELAWAEAIENEEVTDQ